MVERPAHGADPAEIMWAAEVMLHGPRPRTGSVGALYDPSAVAEQVARYELSAALPGALERGELALVYQPIVALPTRALCRVEALVRRHQPQLGTLTPDRFIDLAEETGLVVPLGSARVAPGPPGSGGVPLWV